MAWMKNEPTTPHFCCLSTSTYSTYMLHPRSAWGKLVKQNNQKKLPPYGDHALLL